jgi:hypothetical protein
MHPPAPRSGRHAALLLLAGSTDSTGSTGSKPAASSPLQGAGLAETGLLRAVQQHAGAVGAAALSLAWRPDHGTGGRIQLPFPGSRYLAHKKASFRPWRCCNSSRYHPIWLRFAPCQNQKTPHFYGCQSAQNTAPDSSPIDTTGTPRAREAKQGPLCSAGIAPLAHGAAMQEKGEGAQRLRGMGSATPAAACPRPVPAQRGAPTAPAYRRPPAALRALRYLDGRRRAAN